MENENKHFVLRVADFCEELDDYDLSFLKSYVEVLQRRRADKAEQTTS